MSTISKRAFLATLIAAPLAALARGFQNAKWEAWCNAKPTLDPRNIQFYTDPYPLTPYREQYRQLMEKLMEDSPYFKKP